MEAVRAKDPGWVLQLGGHEGNPLHLQPGPASPLTTPEQRQAVTPGDREEPQRMKTKCPKP